MALDDYRVKSLTSNDDYFLPKIRCFNALSDWEVIINLTDLALNSEQTGE